MNVKPGVPVPTCTVPTATRSPAGDVPSRRVHVGLRQVRGPQARPAVKVIFAGSLLNLCGFRSPGAPRLSWWPLFNSTRRSPTLTTALPSNTRIWPRSASKSYRPGLSNRVLALWALIRTLFSGRISATSTMARPFGTATRVSARPGFCGLVIDPQRNTGCQQNLGPAILSRERLALRQPGSPNGLFAKRLAAHRGPPFDVVDRSRLRGYCAPRRGTYQRSQEPATECLYP